MDNFPERDNMVTPGTSAVIVLGLPGAQDQESSPGAASSAGWVGGRTAAPRKVVNDRPPVLIRGASANCKGTRANKRDEK